MEPITEFINGFIEGMIKGMVIVVLFHGNIVLFKLGRWLDRQ